MVRIELVGPQWDRRAKLEWVLFDVLYRDFGVVFDDPWRHEGPEGIVAVALGDSGELLGALRLLPGERGTGRQLRQMAVVPAARRAGVGRALVEAMERIAAAEGASIIVLNARDTAFDFYRHLGYDFSGDTFVSALTGIAHRPMLKRL